MIPDNAPEKARELLDDADPGPWEVDYDGAWEPAVWSPDGIIFGPYFDREDMEQWEAGSAANLRLAAAAPTLAAIVAEMHEEWGVEWPADEDGTPQTTWGMPDRDYAESYARYLRDDPHRLLDGLDPSAIHVVRRYVTKQEKIT